MMLMNLPMTQEEVNHNSLVVNHIKASHKVVITLNGQGNILFGK